MNDFLVDSRDYQRLLMQYDGEMQFAVKPVVLLVFNLESSWD